MRQDGLAGTVTADLEYPPRVAFVLLTQLLEQYAEQVPWQSEIRHEAIRFPPMDKMIIDFQVGNVLQCGNQENNQRCKITIIKYVCSTHHEARKIPFMGASFALF